MLGAQALRPLLRYFTSMDRAVSNRLMSPTPWDENALTSMLCDLLDEKAQQDLGLEGDLSRLRDRLSTKLPLVDLSFAVEAHNYPSHFENRVSQSDLGLVIHFADLLRPERNWQSASLLQAKRLFRLPGTTDYGPASKFDSHDSVQQQRMLELNHHLGYELAKYLLYVPRPEKFGEHAASVLRHVRDLNMMGRFFDGAMGLEMHREYLGNGASLDAGLIVAPADHDFKRFIHSYGDLFRASLPWCWFLARTLVDPSPVHHEDNLLPAMYRTKTADDALVALVTGDVNVAQEVFDAVGWGDRAPVPFLPARSITIVVTVGADAFIDDLRLRDPN